MPADRWPDVDRLFHAALERPPAERAAFLEGACGRDTWLRREVESLLRHEPDAEDFLERSALQQEAEKLAGEAAADAATPEIPGFRILRTLGEGGMGIVYLAEQLAPIRRQVALKLIKHGMDTRRVIARFDAERQALALMRHPNIAAVHDAGTTAGGRPYFVMEYVEGVPITEYCDRHRLSTRVRLELFVEVCGAVQHAHQKGVIHRDLKPSNVLVSDEGGRPQPKIIDFGVAKAIDHSLSAQTVFTEHGVLVGTPEYMSPEQAALSHDIDTTTDVYSLGVLLYELLVGALPFDPDTLRAAGYDEMRRIIRESDPAKPSARLTGAGRSAVAAAAARQTDAARLTRQLQGDLDWITLKAIEKDRRRRYATVAAFAADVAHYLADEPISARAPSAAYRLRKFVHRYQGAVAAVATVFVVLSAGLVASLTQYARAESQRIEANRQRAQAEAQRMAAEDAARNAAVQRNAALRATDQANRLRAIADIEAATAQAAEREAQFRAYAATINAAEAELRTGFSTDARQRLLAVPAALRDWEWHHLFLKSDSSLLTLSSNSPCVRPGDDMALPVTISDHVLTIGAGDRLYLRRCETVEEWQRPTNAHVTHQAEGKVLAIDPSGGPLIVGQSAPGAWNLQLIDSATRRGVARFGPFAAEPICADFNRDGRRLAVGFRPEYSQIGEPLEDYFDVWDVGAERRALRLAPPRPPLFDTRRRFPTSCLVAFSPDSAWLATSGSRIHVWRTDTGAEIAADPTQAGNVAQPIAWGPNGQLAVGRLTGLVDILLPGSTPRLERLDGSDFIRVLPLPDGDRRILVGARAANEVLTIAFSTDGAWVITGRDRTIGVWSVTQRKLSKVLAGHSAAVTGVGIDAASRIVSADISGAVKVWPPASAASAGVTILPGTASPAGEFVMSRDGRVVGTAQTDGALSAWQLDDFREILLRPGSGQMDLRKLARSLAITPQGDRVLAAELDAVGTVRSWPLDAKAPRSWALNEDPGKGCENMQPTSTTYAVGLMAVTPDGRSIVYKQGFCVVVRDLSSGRLLATLHEYASSFSFRRDGSVLLTAYPWRAQPTGRPGHAKVIIWDWRTNRILAEQVTPETRTDFENGSWRATISADGRYIALIGGRPATASIWDGDLRHELCRFPVPPDTQRLAFSPDGRRLASTSSDTTVRLWDVERRQMLLILTDEDRLSGGLAFTPDGRLIAGRSSGGLTVWDSVRR